MENEILDNGYDRDLGPIEYASFWNRAAASILDGLILAIPSTALVLYGVFSKELLLVLAGSIIAFVYKVYMEGTYSATLGKMIVKIKMINEEGQDLSMQESIKKNMIYIIGQVISLTSMLLVFQNESFQEAEGYMESMAQLETSPLSTLSSMWSFLIFASVIAVVFNSRTRQTLHDMIANTYCIKINPDLV